MYRSPQKSESSNWTKYSIKGRSELSARFNATIKLVPKI
jgi:hypothetical protein